MSELLPDKNKPAIQTRECLRKIHDILGSIPDSDFTFRYILSLPQASKEVQEILDKENDPRHT